MNFDSWLSYFDKELSPTCLAYKAYCVRTFRIANKLIRLHTSKVELLDLFSLALEHLAKEDYGDADLDIYIWERGDFGFQFDANKEMQTKAEFNGSYSISKDVVSILQPESKRAFYWIKDQNHLQSWQYSAPLRELLYWYYIAYDIALVHGAVIGEGDSGVLITAKGGSGKSTVSMNCLEQGLNYIADDYAAISAKTLQAFSLYNSLKLDFDNQYLKDDFKKNIWNKHPKTDQKAIIFLNKILPKQLKDTLNLKAIFVPKITENQNCEIERINGMQALLAILPSTLKQNLLFADQSGSLIKKIVSSLPCYQLSLGVNPESNVNKIKDFLRKDI